MQTAAIELSQGERFAHAEGNIEFRRQQSLMKTGALHDVIFKRAYFSSTH